MIDEINSTELHTCLLEITLLPPEEEEEEQDEE